MIKYENRPYVVCHILSSLNGKISGEYFAMPQLMPIRDANMEIRAGYDCDAVLNGAVTCAEIYADGYADSFPKAKREYPRENFVAQTGLHKFVVCVDTEGRLQWSRNTIERKGQPKSHIIVILTEDVSDDYIAHLKDTGISYLFAGKSALDIPMALQKLKKLFRIDSLMICGGGVVNWSFLQAGMMDELSPVVAPLTDGATDTASVFDRSP